MNLIPKNLLKRLYTRGSLQNTTSGVSFLIKNRLSDAQLIALQKITIGDVSIAPENITLALEGDVSITGDQITVEQPIAFPLRRTIRITAHTEQLVEGNYPIKIAFKATPFGSLQIQVEDSITVEAPTEHKIPRDELDDYQSTAIQDRQNFTEDFTTTSLHHLKQYSFDPKLVKGNCEHFIGAAQIPVGIAGPITIQGEHAQGDFLIPMATTEGTLVASYNRGMKALNLSGGVTCTVVDDAMQRAPVFIFQNAREARDFSHWVKENFTTIAQKAMATSSIATLTNIDTYLTNKFAFLRFNYTTGDAAGQNMVGKATLASCQWILASYQANTIQDFYLEGNLATDKKASHINVLRTRGKRVVAACTLRKEVLEEILRVTPTKLATHYNVANIGALLAGTNNNGLHSANGITAMFIATGQDVANVSESSTGLLFSEITADGDFYMSITLPSLIVATYGGGTGLATQQEALAMLGCVGKGKVNKLAEIIAGVVLAGEVSLAAAISSSDWVKSHEQFGRNR